MILSNLMEPSSLHRASSCHRSVHPHHLNFPPIMIEILREAQKTLALSQVFSFVFNYCISFIWFGLNSQSVTWD